jgi:RimJ/RimL family protein N-acetyltransferase
MTNYTERTFGIKALYGRVMIGNVASFKFMEKTGYIYFEEVFG